jgi:hypothetical protein
MIRWERTRLPRTYTTFAPALANAEHGDIASIRGMLVHTLLAHYDTYRFRRSRRYCLKGDTSYSFQVIEGGRNTHEKRKLWPVHSQRYKLVIRIRQAK